MYVFQSNLELNQKVTLLMDVSLFLTTQVKFYHRSLQQHQKHIVILINETCLFTRDQRSVK